MKKISYSPIHSNAYIYFPHNIMTYLYIWNVYILIKANKKLLHFMHESSLSLFEIFPFWLMLSFLTRKNFAAPFFFNKLPLSVKKWKFIDSQITALCNHLFTPLSAIFIYFIYIFYPIFYSYTCFKRPCTIFWESLMAVLPLIYIGATVLIGLLFLFNSVIDFCFCRFWISFFLSFFLSFCGSLTHLTIMDSSHSY